MPAKSNWLFIDEPLAIKEFGERPFSADGIADQRSQKIERFIAAETAPRQSNLMGEGFKLSFCCEVLGQDDYLGEPHRNRGTIHRRSLKLYA